LSFAESVIIGSDLPELRLPPITRANLALFAGASHDHTPIHIDIDYVRQMGRDDVFAHGMYVMANMARLLTDWRPQRNLLHLEGRFLDIVNVGNALRYTGKIIGIREVLEERHADISILVVAQDGRAVMSGKSVVKL
tara:strand:- start:1465 stop:1875 length:411 start_codon:yes stop_codon:yes gene_type:complete